MAIRRTLRPGEETIRRNVYENIRLGVEQVNFHLPQNTPIALCAGGPTLKNHLEEVRKLQLEGAEVVCLGNAGALLSSAGIKTNGHVLMDGMERNKAFVVPIKDCRYFVASQCDPAVFKALDHHDYVYIWHAKGPEGITEILNKYYGPGGFWLIPGGSFITLRAIPLLHVLGYKWINVFGFDSCLMEDEHHSYSQPEADGQQVEDVTVGNPAGEHRDFRCTYWMLDQASQFFEMLKKGFFQGIELAVHGDGLISYMLKSGNGPTWRLE